MAALGQGASAFGKYQSAKAEASGLGQQAVYEESAAQFNADIAEQTGSAVVGQARALRAASGVAFTGSPLTVDEATVRQVAINAAEIRRQGQQKAQALRAGAKNIKKAGKIGAVASLLKAPFSLGFGE